MASIGIRDLFPGGLVLRLAFKDVIDPELLSSTLGISGDAEEENDGGEERSATCVLLRDTTGEMRAICVRRCVTSASVGVVAMRSN